MSLRLLKDSRLEMLGAVLLVHVCFGQIELLGAEALTQQYTHFWTIYIGEV